MLPITEFQFAFCGIATFAATFGYACARRASSRSPPSIPDVAPEEKTLKRKLDDSDAESEEEQERPVKRSRTPPNDHEEEEWEVIIPPHSCQEAENAAPHPEPTAGQEPPTGAQDGTAQAEEGAADADEPTPTNVPQAPVICEIVKAAAVAPQGEVQPQPNEPESQPQSSVANEPRSRPATPPPPAIPKPVSHRPNATAFSAFTNTQSPFAKYSNTPFPSSTSTSTPAWRCVKSRVPNIPAENAGALCPNDNGLSQSPNEITEASSASALADRAPASTVPKTSSHVTGEEGESVSAELRGVKLFIKRGRKEFTDGNYGHIKILAHNERTRLRKSKPIFLLSVGIDGLSVFRRDPLGQVSMNVALRPAVRCHYDAGENILRVVLMEQVVVEGKEAKDEVVIYALKPGRSSKADFKVLAETLCANDHLKAAS